MSVQAMCRPYEGYCPFRRPVVPIYDIFCAILGYFATLNWSFWAQNSAKFFFPARLWCHFVGQLVFFAFLFTFYQILICRSGPRWPAECEYAAGLPADAAIPALTAGNPQAGTHMWVFFFTRRGTLPCQSPSEKIHQKVTKINKSGF